MVIVVAALTNISAQQKPALSGGLPPELAPYRNWIQLLKYPRPVPARLWLQCAPVTEADLEAARKEYGPHTFRYITVLGNERAAKSLAQSTPGPLPVGSIIAKEKQPVSPDAAPDGIGFMIRRAAPAFAETDGWEFLFFPASGDRKQTHDACAACHRSAPSGNYVFGSYPKPAPGGE